ncbi:hypothetical protein Tco_1090795 [Tanacetum coccineum]|uniref:Uncharacterized protein n=1 Tax=Tanacetum coccineum TaxID=301880 RepID=A0ABQ5I754_9ASTR
MMLASKSFEKHHAHKELYDALIKSLLVDEDDMDQAATVVASKKTSKGDTLSKSFKTGKSASAKEPFKEAAYKSWFNNLLYAQNDSLTFDELIATPIDFSNFAKNRLKLDKITKANLVRPIYNLLKGTCQSSIELEYNIEECFKALSHPGHLTVAAEYFFNNDLEYLKSIDSERKYTTSITKMKVARYDLVGIEDMILKQLSATKVGYDKDVEHGIKHWGPKLQHKLLHLHGEVIVDLPVALHMFTRSLIIKKRVEDVQFGVESYQKKLIITKPQKDFLGISAKELYKPSFEPPGVVYKDLSHRKRLMRVGELYKFSDRTLKKVHDTLHHRLRNF